MTLILFQGCKKDETKAATNSSDLSATAAGGGGNDQPEKDKKNDKKETPAGELKEVTVDLLQLAKVWPTLDSTKNKIRVEGYVTRVWPMVGKQCSVDVLHYPYLTGWITPFNQKMLTLGLSELYPSKEDCDALLKHKISVLIDPIKKDEDATSANVAALVTQVPDKDEDASDEFKQFYPNLISAQYPELKVLKLEDFVKEALKKETPHLLQAKVVKSESTETDCKLALGEGDSANIIVSNYKDQSKNHSEAAITKDNCTSIKDKYILLNGYLNDNKKDIEADSYFITEAK